MVGSQAEQSRGWRFNIWSQALLVAVFSMQPQ
jgi:hypothetical protein